MKRTLIATTTFGLEAVVRREIEQMGYRILATEDGKVTFAGDERAIARANLWLRAADRVLIKMDEFKADESEELFQRVQGLPWEEWIPMDGKVDVTCSTVRSVLRSEPANQRTVKKAIALRLSDYYGQSRLPETGSSYPVKITLRKDKATLTLNTTGVGLHKRGYRRKQLAAPIKETLAAAMIQLSFWKEGRLLLDPACGSGTIPIEAAMIGRNIAPGLTRHFLCEDWDPMSTVGAWETIWKEERKAAYEAIRSETELDICACDIDPRAISIAKANAENAGVEEDIRWTTGDGANPAMRLQEMKKDPPPEHGLIITNPPYGVRIGEQEEIDHLIQGWHRFYAEHPTWSLFVILPPDPDVEERLFGRPADRRRKLYNGRMEVCYYQFHGQKPIEGSVRRV